MIGRDEDAYYFPKANDKDEDIRHIIEDQAKCSQIHGGDDFKKFEDVQYDVLGDYNHLAAQAVLKRDKRRKDKAAKAAKEKAK